MEVGETCKPKLKYPHRRDINARKLETFHVCGQNCQLYQQLVSNEHVFLAKDNLLTKKTSLATKYISLCLVFSFNSIWPHALCRGLNMNEIFCLHLTRNVVVTTEKNGFPFLALGLAHYDVGGYIMWVHKLCGGEVGG